jgi:hypothetical protein
VFVLSADAACESVHTSAQTNGKCKSGTREDLIVPAV